MAVLQRDAASRASFFLDEFENILRYAAEQDRGLAFCPRFLLFLLPSIVQKRMVLHAKSTIESRKDTSDS